MKFMTLFLILGKRDLVSWDLDAILDIALFSWFLVCLFFLNHHIIIKLCCRFFAITIMIDTGHMPSLWLFSDSMNFICSYFYYYCFHYCYWILSIIITNVIININASVRISICMMNGRHKLIVIVVDNWWYFHKLHRTRFSPRCLSFQHTKWWMIAFYNQLTTTWSILRCVHEYTKPVPVLQLMW